MTAHVQRVDPAAFVPDAPGPAADVRRIAEACDLADGVITLNEQACLQLKHRGLQDASLWLATPPDDGGHPAGFALLRGHVLDLAVHPEARGRGLGTELARAALAATDQVEAWSHADHPAAARIAARFGLSRERELRIMSRPTSSPVPDVAAPPGVRVRTFRPDDTDALLQVNSAAFAHHPEQGDLTVEDFRERTAEPWFDPEGLFLAVLDDDTVDDADPGLRQAGPLLGFHWTKVHRDEDPPYGEVYVVAANPRAAGRGLGTLLTAVGLRHLATQGVDEVILYVDGDNEPAIALYEGLGFRPIRTEAQYRGQPG